MLVEVLLDTELGVHYGFLTLCSEQAQDADSADDAWRAQLNGLLGAAVPQMLRIRTLTHTGQVHIRVELYDSAPELSDDWPEVVEVCFASQEGNLGLSAFEEFDGPVLLPPGSYQVRYATRAIPEPPDDELDEESTAEECLLQFWPAAGTDRIVRQTSESAAYWHREGTEAAWTAAELAGQVELLRSSQEEPPVDDLGTGLSFGPYHYLIQSLGFAGRQVGDVDPEFAAHLLNADQATLRAITAWAVDQSLTITRIRDLPGLDEALAALRRGTDLPPDFADPQRVDALLPPLPASLEELKAGGDFSQAVETRRAITQLSQAAGPISMEKVCLMLLSTSLFTGTLNWIVAAARHIFPQVVPTNRPPLRLQF